MMKNNTIDNKKSMFTYEDDTFYSDVYGEILPRITAWFEISDEGINFEWDLDGATCIDKDCELSFAEISELKDLMDSMDDEDIIENTTSTITAEYSISINGVNKVLIVKIDADIAEDILNGEDVFNKLINGGYEVIAEDDYE